MNAYLEKLETILTTDIPTPLAIAVSGGVDSMTLAFIAHRLRNNEATIYHAVSPAVPPAATERVQSYANAYGWQLRVLSAGEFDDEDYLANPSNRCFHCKTNLYGTIVAQTTDQVLSGTNLDDLDDWRPGLEAAKNHAVRHPFVEVGINKENVRALARYFDLNDLAELPAAPCLSSRIETGIPIKSTALSFVDETEQMIRSAIVTKAVRCRIRRSGVVIELDDNSYKQLTDQHFASLTASVARLAEKHAVNGSVSFAPYRMGSAFLREQT